MRHRLRRKSAERGHHTETAFEAAIEVYLTTAGRYATGDQDAFDRERGIDASVFLAFVQETQPNNWKYLQNLQKEKAEAILLDDLCRALNSGHEGCLSVLRHGFKCFEKLFPAAYFAPASGMNPEAQRLYAANQLTITRQLRYSSRHWNTLDATRGSKDGNREAVADMLGLCPDYARPSSSRFITGLGARTGRCGAPEC